jgi:hypothetical protein
MRAVKRLDHDIGCAISLNVEGLRARLELIWGNGRAEIVKELDIVADVVGGGVIEYPAIPDGVGDRGEGD